MDLAALRACLACPVCARTLQNPTTLPCGHTVCQTHQISPCPLPHCAPPPRPARPRIPPASRVNYLPPPPAPLAPPPEHTPKPDVTINKVLALLDSVLGEDSSYDDDDDDILRSAPRSPTVRTRPDSPGPSRPRKRQRIHDDPSDDEGDLLSHLMSAAARQRDTAPHVSLTDRMRPLPPPPSLEKELQTELACEICFMLLYSPVTTPCQHTFCSKCLHRALDHSNLCPLCRDSLPGFSFFDDHPGNQTLETLLATAFPAEYTARGAAIAAEERDARLDTPIFVCMLIFPGHPTALHFFEPRYRLMLRRCLEQDVPSFGMIMPARTGAGAGVTAQTADYGTMLEVRSVQMLADGRSMVETWSTYRFRILERGTLDGYTVGRIERIDDVPDSPSLTLAGPSNEELMETCTAFLHQLRRGTAPWVVQRLNNVYGAPPADPAAFAYWVALILPIDEFEKAKLLPIRSARLRLRLVVHWIEQLNNNWWFTSGCVIF
ncbi:PUA-like domain-containing protein [Mycena alexandri]|uniref:PUA-like domain-containing protein n=1 Tax=Mycena alexandri TaxID=1745969 RepID=A0AAD6TL69_9AGAR|nr:PUA-like domain-containing protein [Mycena alexandri]